MPGARVPRRQTNKNVFLVMMCEFKKLFWNYFRCKVIDCARGDQEKYLTRVNKEANVLKNSKIVIGGGG